MTDASKQGGERDPRSRGPGELAPADPPVFGSATAAAARRAVAHFAGRDERGGAAAPDPVELWGRRIGRGLSLVACIGLGLYLYLTYLR